MERGDGSSCETLIEGGLDVPEKELGDAGEVGDAAPPAPAEEKPTVSAASVDLEGRDKTVVKDGDDAADGDKA